MSAKIDKRFIAQEHARYAKSQGRIDPLYEKLHVWHLDETDPNLANMVRRELKKDYPLTPRLRKV